MENTLSKPIVEKIFKYQKSRSGKTTFNKKKIGILVGAIDESGKIAIGHSLLHKNDIWDVVDGVRRPGFGMNLAVSRAIKYVNSDRDWIEVPASILKQIHRFQDRCLKYYKQADRENLPSVYTNTEQCEPVRRMVPRY